MTISMYQASVPVFVKQLEALAAILRKGEAHAAEAGLDPRDLLDAKLINDMFPLTRQVQTASDAAKGAAARLGGLEAPSFADIEASFTELQDRIARTLDFLNSVPPEAIDGSEEKEIIFKLPSRDLRFTGQQFLLHFALPNFFFHVTTAYGLLRHKGVPIGKMDFLGRP